MTVHILKHGVTLCGSPWSEVSQADRWISYADGLPDGAPICGACLAERRERERRAS